MIQVKRGGSNVPLNTIRYTRTGKSLLSSFYYCLNTLGICSCSREREGARLAMLWRCLHKETPLQSPSQANLSVSSCRMWRDAPIGRVNSDAFVHSQRDRLDTIMKFDICADVDKKGQPRVLWQGHTDFCAILKGIMGQSRSHAPRLAPYIMFSREDPLKTFLARINRAGWSARVLLSIFWAHGFCIGNMFSVLNERIRGNQIADIFDKMIAEERNHWLSKSRKRQPKNNNVDLYLF